MARKEEFKHKFFSLTIWASFLPFSIYSVQFSHLAVSDSLRPHELQHSSPPCPSPTPGVHPNSWPLSQWMPSNHLILCRPLLLPSIFPSISIFSNESALHIRRPKYWRFSFNISPSNEHPGLISFRMDWLDLLAVQGTQRVFSNTTVQETIRSGKNHCLRLKHHHLLFC